jgi:hypothetical protein
MPLLDCFAVRPLNPSIINDLAYNLGGAAEPDRKSGASGRKPEPEAGRGPDPLIPGGLHHQWSLLEEMSLAKGLW